MLKLHRPKIKRFWIVCSSEGLTPVLHRHRSPMCGFQSGAFQQSSIFGSDSIILVEDNSIVQFAWQQAAKSYGLKYRIFSDPAYLEMQKRAGALCDAVLLHRVIDNARECRDVY